MCHFVCLAHFTLSKQCVWGDGWLQRVVDMVVGGDLNSQ